MSRVQAVAGNKSERSVGWYAGVLVFWLLTGWLITVGLSSIIPQIFGPAAPAHVSGNCQEDLGELMQELLARTTREIRDERSAADRDTLDAWLTDFDRRLLAVKPSCNERERDALQALLRVRHARAAAVERFDREEAPHIRKVRDLLGAAASPHP